MGNSSITNFHAKKIEVDLVLDTSVYAPGDVLSDRVAVQVAGITGGKPVRGEIIGITVLDKDDQAQPLDLVVLDANKSLGTFNVAPTITDPGAQSVVAVVPVNSWTDLGLNQIARPSFDPIFFESADGYVYIGAIARGSPTHTAAGIRLKLLVRLHNVNL